MNFLDVFASRETLINLNHVRCIETEAGAETAEIKFVYGNGEEDIYWVSPGRLAVLDDILHDLKVVTA